MFAAREGNVEMVRSLLCEHGAAVTQHTEEICQTTSTVDLPKLGFKFSSSCSSGKRLAGLVHVTEVNEVKRNEVKLTIRCRD